MPTKKSLQANVDWLTVTTKKEDVGADLYKIMVDYKSNSRGSEMLWGDRSFYGYEGVGSSHVFWGYHNRNGYILQLKGDVAHAHFGQLKGTLANVTRMDIAVTIELNNPIIGLGNRYYNKILNDGRLSRKLTEVKNSQGGNTLYIGSRSSSQMGRIYDKGAQMGGDAGRIWRYEVELKKPRALPTAQVFWGMLGEGVTFSSVESTLAHWVHEWFLARGVKCPWRRDAKSDFGKIRVEYGQTDKDKKLQWLRSQVRPSVQWLFSNGFTDETLEALGLNLDQLSLME